MRRITKGREPASLTAYRFVNGASYEGYRDKDKLRRCLAKEQRGLCCYCMSRIRPSPGAMRVEHWHCQHSHSGEQLDYANMLGACMGNQGMPAKHQHCDARKGDRDLSRNPANPSDRVDELLRFLGDGMIV